MTPPIPKNEMSRLLKLSEFDLDYSGLENIFADLTLLASKITGTPISLINLIDSYTQWTVSKHGLEIEQMPREDSVCQYTIANGEHFEVPDLKVDERFNMKSYVTGEPNVSYYFGVPLKSKEGLNLGALCVLDKTTKTLDPEKIEMLKIIASEIVKRLEIVKNTQDLNNKIREARETQKKLAHDIRGPLGGIVGLAKLIVEQGNNTSMEEIIEINQLIQQGGMSILDLADEILNKEKETIDSNNSIKEFNLENFREKLLKLYTPQALNKKINFSVTSTKSSSNYFSKNKLLQITGNLISNAIKFTPENGAVDVNLDLLLSPENSSLDIMVKDSGVGIDEVSIHNILNGNGISTDGTGGENGYGFGLALVKHLVEDMKGSINIQSSPGMGAAFNVRLPQFN